MKKWMISYLVGFGLLSCSVYIFIPNVVGLKTNIAVKATGQGIHRMLLNKENIAKWWPGKISNDSFYFNDFAYTINNGNITVLPVSITAQNTDLTTSLFLISISTDSTFLEWVGSMVTSYNPAKRIGAYVKAKKINRDMISILQKMKSFYSDPANIYGFEIKKDLLTDSILIATTASCKGYPTNQFIYDLIEKLKIYIKKNSANESGYPMLNVSTADSINFDIKVAIPTNKILPSSGNIIQKRMPSMGNILTTEVKGGIGITGKAFEQMQKYADDYQRKAPAIPYYSLITDRTKEPDTSKWLTKIYFPVM